MNQHPPPPTDAHGVSHPGAHAYNHAPGQHQGPHAMYAQPASTHPAQHQAHRTHGNYPAHGGAAAHTGVLPNLYAHEQPVAFFASQDTGAVVGRWLIGLVIAMGGIAFLMAIKAKAKGLVAVPAIAGGIAMRSAITANKTAPLGLLVTNMRVIMVGPKGETAYEHALQPVSLVAHGSAAPAGATDDPSYWARAKSVVLVGYDGRRQELASVDAKDAARVGATVAKVLRGVAEPIGVAAAANQLRDKQRRGSTRGSLLLLATIVTPVLLIVAVLGTLVQHKKAQKEAREERAAEQQALVEAQEEKTEKKAGDAVWVYRAGKSAKLAPDFKQWGVTLENPFGIAHRAFLFHDPDDDDDKYNSLAVHELDFGNMKPAPKTGATYEVILGKAAVILIKANPRMADLKAILKPLSKDYSVRDRPESKVLKEHGWTWKKTRYEELEVGDTKLTMASNRIVHTDSSTEAEYMLMPLILELVRGKKVYTVGMEDSSIQRYDGYDLYDGLKKHKP